MLEKSLLRATMAAFDEIAGRYQGAGKSDIRNLQREQVADRLSLHTMLAQLRPAGRKLLAAPADEQLLRKFEDSVARFRHALTLHQANWPVVTIDPEGVEYLSSRQTVRLAHRDLRRLIEDILKRPASSSASHVQSAHSIR